MFLEEKQVFGDNDDGDAPRVLGLRRRLPVQGRAIQYLDMKHMIDVLERQRARVRALTVYYRGWKATYATETDDIEKAYAAYEGIFIRRQLQDAWTLYVTVNQDYHEMYRVYMASLSHPPHRRAAT